LRRGRAVGREVVHRRWWHHAQLLGGGDDALGGLELRHLQAQLLLLDRRGVGRGAEVLEVEVVLREDDVEGDDAEQAGGDGDAGEHDEPAGALPAGACTDVALGNNP